MKGNILYVDDEQSSLNALKNLYRRKFNIITANSGQKALEILETQAVQVIVTDQRMPEMTGIDFLLKVKHKWPDLKSILLTAFDESSVIKDAINEAGIYWYLNKPFEPDQLEQIITNALNAFNAENKLKESEEKFRGVFESMIDVFTRSDIEGNCLLISPSVIEVAGYTQEEIIGTNYSDFFVHQDQWRQNVNEIIEAGGKSISLDQEVYRKDGTKMFISSNAKLFYDEYGNPAGIESVFRDISEIKNTEILLLESERKYRSLVDNSLVGVFTTTLDGRFIYVNEAMVDIYEFDNADQMIAEESLARWNDPKQREQMLLSLQKYGEVTNIETESITHTGRHIHVIFSVKKQEDHILGMVMDITDRKNAEEELQESERTLKASQQMAHVGNWIWEIEENIITWSEEVYRIYGIAPGTKVTYDLLMQVIHPEDREYHNKQTGEWMKNISVEPYKYRVVTPDGSLKHVYAMGEVERDKSGNPLKFIGTVQDISLLTQAESEHDKLFNSSFDLICIAGFDGYFKELNPYWEQVTGYSLEELYATPFSEFVHPDDVEKTSAEVQELINGKGAAIDFENRYITKAGKEIHLSWRVTPAFEEKVMFCIAREITDRKMAEDKVVQYQQRLKDLANELTINEEMIRKQIAVDLHDDVGQLLASMHMQMAKITDMEENPELTLRMDNISQGLLKSIQATRAAIFDLSPPQLNEIGLAAATQDWMKEEIEQKHHIKTVFSGESEVFKLDENTRFLLFRSIKELMINTVKHAKASQLTMTFNRIGNTLEMTIEDDGIGFSYNPDLLKLKSDTYGLFSIQERISDLGGLIEVDSVIDKGTKITLAVPINDKLT